MRVVVDGVAEPYGRRIADLMDPYRPVPADGPGDLTLVGAAEEHRPRLREIHNPARDGVVTASDGERLYLMDGERWCSLPESGEVRFQAGFPAWKMFGSVVLPAIQHALADRGAVCVHSASVDIDGSAVVVAGWSETGKTETALALLEEGARFLSDKWSILVPEGGVGAFPISVGIRRWVLRYLPRLRAALPRAARAQLLVAGGLGAVTGPLRRRGLPGRVGGLAVGSIERAIALADRAALTPSEVARAYGHEMDPATRPPLGAVAILTTVPAGSPPRARFADPAWAATRLARSAAYERRGLAELMARGGYAFPERAEPGDEPAVIRDGRLLAAAFADVTVIEVRAPFPTDPRRVADAIGELL